MGPSLSGIRGAAIRVVPELWENAAQWTRYQPSQKAQRLPGHEYCLRISYRRRREICLLGRKAWSAASGGARGENEAYVVGNSGTGSEPRKVCCQGRGSDIRNFGQTRR